MRDAREEQVVVPVVHRRDQRPAPTAIPSEGGDGRGRSLWTHRVNHWLPGRGGVQNSGGIGGTPALG
jgi:hypothetical protein